MTNEGVADRLNEFIDFSGFTATYLALKADLDPSNFNKMLKKQKPITDKTINKIISATTINREWLLTGAGEMLRDDSSSMIKQYSVKDKGDYYLVPIIHIDSVGGMHSNNDIVEEPQYIEGYAPFTDARDGDICIVQSGDSMNPTCPSGSLLLLREVFNWKEYIGYGNIFVLELTDGRRITKEVTRYNENPKDYFWCVSHNPNVPDEELPKSMIVSVWKVIKILINNGW